MAGNTKRRAAAGNSGQKWKWALALCAAAFVAWTVVEIASLPSDADIEQLERKPVRETALMRARRAEAADRGRHLRPALYWVDFGRISPAVVSAVVASEDARFFVHSGLDLKEVHEALRDRIAEGRKLRGASTLTQQVAKNLYLSEDRSLLRKLKEAVIAWRLEQALSKRRILTLYLNIAEWGDGVFGIEAAARTHLRKHASEVSLAEAAALAAMLPSPRRFNPAHPAVLRRRAAHVLDRVEEEHLASAAEVAAARAELEAWLGSQQARR